ncbi:MAG: phosphoribosyltransferase family protein [Flavobacteriaceae bacterium]|nr:phosphoribosyltransferase family protein [Flavobacteriaceae bacterium]MDG2314997.1 phosphoribosyltransferase family protein [Flavobacteriaceae bacterium]
MENLILNHQQIEHKIRRIAFQVLESNIQENEIILAGIASNGYVLAEKIGTALSNICDAKVSLCKVHIDKSNPFDSITTSLDVKDYTNKSLVLIDDVLHTGTTLIYSVNHFLKVPLKQFKTAVLVNRNHKKYPVKADFKGISLSTSLQENVEVIFDFKNSRVVLD